MGEAGVWLTWPRKYILGLYIIIMGKRGNAFEVLESGEVAAVDNEVVEPLLGCCMVAEYPPSPKPSPMFP